MRKDVLVAAALLTAGGAYTAHHYEGGGNPATELSAPSAAQALSGYEAQAASEYCDVPALPVKQLETIQSPLNRNMLAQIGQTSANGTVSFGNVSPTSEAKPVAKELAGNTPALATVYELINGPVNQSPEQTAKLAYSEYRKMMASPNIRASVCARVIGTLLDAPDIKTLTSPSGNFDRFQDAFSGDTVSDIEAPQVDKGSEEVFVTAPIVRQQGSSQAEAKDATWGISARGQIDEDAQTQGSSNSKRGKGDASANGDGSSALPGDGPQGPGNQDHDLTIGGPVPEGKSCVGQPECTPGAPSPSPSSGTPGPEGSTTTTTTPNTSGSGTSTTTTAPVIVTTTTTVPGSTTTTTQPITKGTTPTTIAPWGGQ